MHGAQAARLAADRLHLQHGPIDILLKVDADAATTALALQSAIECFDGVLEGLVGELPLLRQAVGMGGAGSESTSSESTSSESASSKSTVADSNCAGRDRGRLPSRLTGPVARRMHTAVLTHADTHFVTPMAAVAGAVADHLLHGILERLAAHGAVPNRIMVNNGGDIALHLAPGRHCRIGLVADLANPASASDRTIRLATGDGIGGVATSGWPGRSHSLGIADAVTVLANDAASADVAATLIANAVDVESPRVSRVPASSLDDDSDLGERLVTVDVGVLTPAEIDTALSRGMHLAGTLLAAGTIRAAWLHLQGHSCTCHDPSLFNDVAPALPRADASRLHREAHAL